MLKDRYLALFHAHDILLALLDVLMDVVNIGLQSLNLVIQIIIAGNVCRVQTLSLPHHSLKLSAQGLAFLQPSERIQTTISIS